MYVRSRPAQAGPIRKPADQRILRADGAGQAAVREPRKARSVRWWSPGRVSTEARRVTGAWVGPLRP